LGNKWAGGFSPPNLSNLRGSRTAASLTAGQL